MSSFLNKMIFQKLIKVYLHVNLTWICSNLSSQKVFSFFEFFQLPLLKQQSNNIPVTRFSFVSFSDFFLLLSFVCFLTVLLLHHLLSTQNYFYLWLGFEPITKTLFYFSIFRNKAQQAIKYDRGLKELHQKLTKTAICSKGETNKIPVLPRLVLFGNSPQGCYH